MAEPTDKQLADSLLKELRCWQANHENLLPVMAASPVLKEIESLSRDLSVIAGIGMKAIEWIAAGKAVESRWLAEAQGILLAAQKPRGYAELAIITTLRQLLTACAAQTQ